MYGTAFTAHAQLHGVDKYRRNPTSEDRKIDADELWLRVGPKPDFLERPARTSFFLQMGKFPKMERQPIRLLESYGLAATAFNRFEDVGFRYPGSQRWAVRHLTFSFQPHERIALVGENGAGKTTLVKLLARLYDPDEGHIVLDGIDLRDYDLDSLRQNIGIIFQDFVRYDFILRENIGVSQIDALSDDARIRQAAQRSLADSVVQRVPQGYDQMLGKRFDNGVELSGGEWQKVALARAYMREAQVLILDEPTAALDARAEYEVFLRFAELTKGRMAVLISHRFSTVRMADRILVLKGGELVDDGTHEELVARGGLYAELFSLQAAGYR